MARSFFLIATLVLSVPLAAQPTLVRDINPSAGSVPVYLTSFDGALYFLANDGASGQELWRSDGTENGTVLVKDINPGATTGVRSIAAFASFFAELDGTLYFAANDGIDGGELWKTDGTEEGTTLAADINSGVSGSNPFALTEFDGMLYFSAFDPVNGNELWKSDGTDVGTELLKDIWPGVPGGMRSIPEFTPFDGSLYFSANDDATGLELWKTDGTEGGTVLVKDIRPGAIDGISNDMPAEYTVYDGALYFVASDGTNGSELWRTDGTEAGTVMVANINPAGESSEPAGLTVFDGALYFAADDGTDGRELWRTDGTEVGTMQVIDIYTGTESSDPAEFTVFSGQLYFMADDGASGLEVWRSDGTEAGTALLADINPGASGIGFGPSPLTVFAGALYFAANDGTNGLEVWMSDGTEAGTALLADIRPGSGAGGGRELTESQGSLFFQANDGTIGQELWVLQGTATSVESIDESSAFALSVFPNPTRGRATVALDVSVALSASARKNVRVDAYDMLGRKVAVLHDGPMAVGTHMLPFNSPALPSGLYFIKVFAGEFRATQGLMLIVD